MEEYVRSDLKSSEGKVEVWAWIEKVRDQKSMQFVILKDRSGMLQMTIEKAKKARTCRSCCSLYARLLCESQRNSCAK